MKNVHPEIIGFFSMVRKRKQDFSHYVSDVLQNSMLTGIPQIAAAGNWPKKAIRTLVFCMCVAGFIYQTLTFMRMYWQYEVIVDVRVSSPSYVDKPSLTFCLKNGIDAKRFCDDPEADIIRNNTDSWCLDYVQDLPNLCECNPRYCDFRGNSRNITGVWDFDFLRDVPREELRKYFLGFREIVKQCHEVKMKVGPYWAQCNFTNLNTLEVPCPYLRDHHEQCFTLNSLIGQPDKKIEKAFSGAEIRLTIDPHDETMEQGYLRNMAHLSVHSPYTVDNPFTNGYPLVNDNDYHIHLKKVVKKLLPYPYSTDCKDYRSEWIAKGGYGPSNLKDCILECQKNVSMEKLGCVERHIYTPGNETRCPLNVYYPEIYVDAMKCSDENCKPACDEEFYIVEVMQQENFQRYCYGDDWENTEPRIYVYIYLDGMETTSYTYSPKFEDIETFSYVGGYVGMWLGISLVAVFDFLETVVVMLKFPIRRCLYFRERKARQDEVRRIHKTF